MRLCLVSGLSLGLLAACAAPEPRGERTLSDRLAGKTVQYETGGLLTFGADGVLLGTGEFAEEIVGTWEVRGGKFCRALLEPVLLSECVDMVFDGDQVYGIRRDGTETARATFQ